MAATADTCALREHRERAGLSLRDLAYFTGAHFAQLSKIERGLHDPAPPLKVAIARVLGVPLSELWPLPSPAPAEPVKRGSAPDVSGRAQSGDAADWRNDAGYPND
jgi:transcriptional regulator with XRE-family HTH domain